MKSIDRLYTRALLESFSSAPLLVGDLPEAQVWKGALRAGEKAPSLDFDQKLGHLYEDALALLIRGSSGYELLAKNLQVSDGQGRTIGELDFLVREAASGIVWHVELAVKFYLSILDTDGAERYPGPDPRDNWVSKLLRMRERQLRLGERPETRQLLAERFGVRELSVGQRIYGIIFDELGAERESRPPAVSPGCRRGKWLRVKDWSRFFSDAKEVALVPKCLWPAPLGAELLAALQRVSAGELKSAAQERCVLFWDAERRDVVFLVPDLWPELG